MPEAERLHAPGIGEPPRAPLPGFVRRGESAQGAQGTLAAARARRLTASKRGFVCRPRLVRRLLREHDATTVLIAAPAGYGKTSLLLEWAARDERQFAWITLSESDNHPGRLLSSLLHALDALEPLPASVAETLDALDGGAPDDEISKMIETAATVVASMAFERHPMVLVLDDLHVLHSGDALRVVGSLAEAMPPGAKLALGSRTEPELRLARLRGAGALLELGANDLAMNAYEAHQLLLSVGHSLDRERIERLVSRTEGWPAGLYLASLSLDDADEDSDAERTAGDAKQISQYVTDEVLGPLPSELRLFLSRTSMLDHLSGSLCDAVLGRSDSARLLQKLASGNLMVLPLDTGRTWYRCHGLLRDVLRTELQVQDPRAAAELNGRASEWFQRCHETDRAIQHAVAGGDVDRAGRLLWANAADYLMRGSDRRLHRLVAGISEEEMARCPELTLALSHARLWSGDLTGAEHLARLASESLGSQTTRHDPSLEAALALIDASLVRRGAAQMGSDAERAYALLGEASPWRGPCSLLSGVALHLTGDANGARGRLDEGVHCTVHVAPLVESLCLAQLALIDAEAGEWEQALERVSLATDRLTAHGLDRVPLASLVLAVSAWVVGHEGHADDAKRHLSMAIQLLETFDGFVPWYEVEARVLLARASIRLADVTVARGLLAQASRHARRMPDVPVFRTWLDDAWAAIDELSAAALGGPDALTIAELRILRFLPTHLSFREIGERLHVSTNTVKSQAHAIYGKLGASSRSEAVARACALGLIEVSIV
ncbi:MAG TPA: AAA family ATPase [Solirubrobacteraceae bacterium]